jgi:hypothetical protein
VGRVRPAIEAVLSDNVFSTRYGPKKRKRSGVDEWLAFQRRGRELYESHTHAFMISTDVASYFEYVEISRVCCTNW